MKKSKDRYERIIKTRRVMAMIGVIVIVLLYVYFFFLAFRNDPNTMPALFAAFAATVIVPVIMYGLGLLAKNMADYSNDGTHSEEEDQDGGESIK
jgi:O-antigen/teichoic acid export membrane protein